MDSYVAGTPWCIHCIFLFQYCYRCQMQEPPNVLHQVSVLYKQQIRYIANNLYPNLLNIKTDDILRSTYLEIQSKKKNPQKQGFILHPTLACDSWRFFCLYFLNEMKQRIQFSWDYILEPSSVAWKAFGDFRTHLRACPLHSIKQQHIGKLRNLLPPGLFKPLHIWQPC